MVNQEAHPLLTFASWQDSKVSLTTLSSTLSLLISHKRLLNFYIFGKIYVCISTHTQTSFFQEDSNLGNLSLCQKLIVTSHLPLWDLLLHLSSHLPIGLFKQEVMWHIFVCQKYTIPHYSRMLALLLKDNHTDLFLTCEMKVINEERGGFKWKLFSAITPVLTTNSIFLELLFFFEDEAYSIFTKTARKCSHS